LRRILIVSLYLVRNLFHSLAGLAPFAVALGLYTITFYYQGQQVDYFAAVGGFDMALVCLTATLVISAQAGRAATYPLLARLPRRADLLWAVFLAGLAIGLVIALAFAGVAAWQRTALFTPAELLAILPRWLALFTLAAALALHLGKFASRAGTRLVVLLVLAIILLGADNQIMLQARGLEWLLAVPGLLASPLLANMMIAVHGATPTQYALAIALPLLVAALLFAVAVWTFQRKDLLWTE
jgi:hypothetical protein